MEDTHYNEQTFDSNAALAVADGGHEAVDN
jgi:hypothetical protein